MFSQLKKPSSDIVCRSFESPIWLIIFPTFLSCLIYCYSFTKAFYHCHICFAYFIPAVTWQQPVLRCFAGEHLLGMSNSLFISSSFNPFFSILLVYVLLMWFMGVTVIYMQIYANHLSKSDLFWAKQELGHSRQMYIYSVP